MLKPRQDGAGNRTNGFASRRFRDATNTPERPVSILIGSYQCFEVGGIGKCTYNTVNLSLKLRQTHGRPGGPAESLTIL